MKLRLPRPLWFAIPTAVVVALMIGLQIGVPAYRQGVAVATIKRLHGSYTPIRSGPEWLRDWLGEEWMTSFDRIDFVALCDTSANDADLADVAGLTGVEQLLLDNTPITDAGLVRINGMRSLQVLSLADTQVTGSGLRRLQGLTHLRELRISDTAVTAEDTEAIKKLTGLKNFCLIGTNVTDEHIAAIQQALPGVPVLHFPFLHPLLKLDMRSE